MDDLGRTYNNLLSDDPRHHVLDPNSDSESLELEYLYSRCSICFTAKQELSLLNCRDQYCLPCFARYIKETVRSSWGLKVLTLKCPVCQDPIEKSEWARYCNPHTVALYEANNQPYRPITRYCPQCDYQNKFACPPLQDRESREAHLQKLKSQVKLLVEECSKRPPHVNDEIMTHVDQLFVRVDKEETFTNEFYHEILQGNLLGFNLSRHWLGSKLQVQHGNLQVSRFLPDYQGRYPVEDQPSFALNDSAAKGP
ncbi:MAG: hypothetical protein SGCHY_004218 [Lobulomycetales sp.]